jgi:hypothetical protein
MFRYPMGDHGLRDLSWRERTRSLHPARRRVRGLDPPKQSVGGDGVETNTQFILPQLYGAAVLKP